MLYYIIFYFIYCIEYFLDKNHDKPIFSSLFTTVFRFFRAQVVNPAIDSKSRAMADELLKKQKGGPVKTQPVGGPG